MAHRSCGSVWRYVLISGALAVSCGLPLPLLDNDLTLPVAQAHHGGGGGASGGGGSSGGKGDGFKKPDQPSEGQGKGGRGVKGLKP
ncbi:MAG: hypothetical protein LAE24_04655 [Candidatus Contendobacter sp.]|nr:hypothetical protein [Candidatus Contendobacter sp.]